MPRTRLAEIIDRHEEKLIADWLEIQRTSTGGRLAEAKLQPLAREFIAAVREAARDGELGDTTRAEWSRTRDLLADLSRERAAQGFSPTETATFVFSFKQAIFKRLRSEFGSDAETLAEETWTATELFDKLGLYTAEIYQKAREEVIVRQQQEMLELSTPVVELWHGILALPLIGTLDSNRTQIVMQNLLEAIVAKSAGIAIIDITGVPTVDTLVAQHLLKTVAAARLMGAECIISGIRPQIAQTIIHLGVDLGGVLTKATLADAFQVALRKKGLAVAKG
ncbi:MAG: STAS domain-containing protein [Bryobacteraceae bacterium]|nr:STAS domain-containing protein [Bryobacteraceae bacterium]